MTGFISRWIMVIFAFILLRLREILVVLFIKMESSGLLPSTTITNISPNAVQQITCNFSRENFMQEILQVKPTANYQDVLDFAESMQVNAEITDSSITQYDDGKVFRIEYRAYITHYDRLLKRKLGIMFYSNSLQDYMSMWI